MSIYESLLALQDKAYKDFTCPLIPTLDPERVIGVRTPDLKKLARSLKGRREAEEFLTQLPHQFYEENNLHSFLLAEIKDFDACIEAVYRFLPHIDNWATCDGFNPKVFKSRRGQLLEHIALWIKSEHIYTRRFAIINLMRHYLDADFSPEYPEMVAAAESGDYYLRMAQA